MEDVLPWMVQRTSFLLMLTFFLVHLHSSYLNILIDASVMSGYKGTQTAAKLYYVMETSGWDTITNPAG